MVLLRYSLHLAVLQTQPAHFGIYNFLHLHQFNYVLYTLPVKDPKTNLLLVFYSSRGYDARKRLIFLFSTPPGGMMPGMQGMVNPQQQAQPRMMRPPHLQQMHGMHRPPTLAVSGLKLHFTYHIIIVFFVLFCFL